MTHINVATATDGYWEYGPLTFSGGTYEGNVQFSSDGSLYTTIDVHVVASGDSIYEVDSISLKQTTAGGVYLQEQRADGVWQEPVTGRNPYRTGGLWTDPCVKADYEYDSSWATHSDSFLEDSGAISSNGEYMTVTGIPTGSEWHGPSFVRTLPSYFTVGDLGAFSANLSIHHHGSDSPMSATILALYDLNKKLVASIMLADAWAYESKAYFRAKYRLEDGTTESLPSDHFYENHLFGVPQIRFDPQTGILADVPGKTERPLFLHSQINKNRLIKYLVIQSYRRKSWPEQDERIYNIRLSYAGSDYTLFHDNCNDVDAFISTPSFPYGSRADGTLESPSGQSYMTWDFIEGGGSGWQGPMYVHTLDRPFRLYQLSEFSVVGQLLQSSYTMGKTYVALFDENKQKVALILWGDSWVGSERGYFKVYFYPQDSSGNSQSSGYIYSSFTKTGKLWWGEGFGGHGAIYTSIDGQGSSYPIVECDNASRVIKYVGILGYRYKSYNLGDMRIHDINVVADLNAEDPTAPEPGEPVEYDGTTDRSTSDSDKDSVDSTLDDAGDFITSYWTGPWPVLHIVIEWVVITNVEFSLHITVDLLLSINVANDGCISIYEPVMNHHGYYGQTVIDKARESTISAMNVLTRTNDPWSDVDIAWAIATAAGVFAGIHPATTAVYLLALTAWIITLVNAVAITYTRVKNGVLTVLEGADLIITKGIVYFIAGLAEIASGLFLNMVGTDSDAAKYCIESIKDRNPAVDMAVEGLLVSGVIQFVAGFSLIMFGGMLGMGIIPV